jgi:hypothetical protein
MGVDTGVGSKDAPRRPCRTLTEKAICQALKKLTPTTGWFIGDRKIKKAPQWAGLVGNRRIGGRRKLKIASAATSDAER